MTRKFLLLTSLLIILNGCTRDDICDPNTATTPLLIIVFKDFASPTLAKQVPNLSVQTTDDDETVVINSASTDSIAIPLRAGNVNTRYLFTINTGSETEEVIDALTFTYNTEDIYVNRACAFKSIYNNLEATKSDDDTSDLIIDFNEEKTIGEDEIEAHFTIFH